METKVVQKAVETASNMVNGALYSFTHEVMPDVAGIIETAKEWASAILPSTPTTNTSEKIATESPSKR